MKVIINKCFGGFTLSDKAVFRYAELKGIKLFKSSTSFAGFSAFYLVPEEEFNITHAKDKVDRNYTESNKLMFRDRDIDRDDPLLAQVVIELGEEASGRCSKLKVVEIPDGICWEIEEYDGMESIHECHKTWG